MDTEACFLISFQTGRLKKKLLKSVSRNKHVRNFDQHISTEMIRKKGMSLSSRSETWNDL